MMAGWAAVIAYEHAHAIALQEDRIVESCRWHDDRAQFQANGLVLPALPRLEDRKDIAAAWKALALAHNRVAADTEMHRAQERESRRACIE